MLRRQFVKFSLLALAAGVCLSGVALGAVLFHIHHSVQERCAAAQEAHPHPGNDAAALIDCMNSDQHASQERNEAVWALGRLRDPAALSALESVYTGTRCSHDTQLCQYELEKAIKLCGGTPTPPRDQSHGETLPRE